MTPRPWRRISILCSVCLLLVIAPILLRGEGPGPEAEKTQQVPVNGEAGPCSVEMTVTDAAGKPVYAATVRVHVSHGFLGMHKTDLEVGTNVDGKAKFIGLPKDRDEVLEFHASKGKQKGTALASPAQNCQSKHFIVLR